MGLKRYKVLVICGGGVFGCIPAHFLAMLPEPMRTLKGVDLLAGCSIGGILAASYAAGHGFAEVDKIFQERASECFDKRFASRINPIANPTYDNDSIDAVLKDMVGDIKLGDVKDKFPGLDLIIPAQNITDDSYKVFDNITNQDLDVPLKDIAGYTSAAPSYYSGRDFKGKCIVDGGMIEVAPLLTATTALKAKRNVPFEDMDVLMIGTGKDVDEKPMTLKRYNGQSLLGLATDVIVPYVTQSNEMATRYWGRQIGYKFFEYFNPCQTNGKQDDVAQIPDTVKQCEQYKEDFVKVWSDWMQ